MRDEAVAGYLGTIPAEIRDAVSALSSPQRWAVFLAILKEDRYFNKLRIELGISAEQLDNILCQLVTCGLVFKEMESPAEIGDRKKSRYTVTPAGEKIVRCLLEGFLPGSSPRHERPTYPLASSRKKNRMSVCDPAEASFSGEYHRPTRVRVTGAGKEKIGIPESKAGTRRTHTARKTPARSPT
jgi:DNA-binding HxlR family transcriptional regulator